MMTFFCYLTLVTGVNEEDGCITTPHWATDSPVSSVPHVSPFSGHGGMPQKDPKGLWKEESQAFGFF